MKLKGKKTGEIGRLKESNCDEYEYLVVIDGNPQVYRYYHTLKEVTDSYEDYEEPKSFYAISLYPVKVIKLNAEIYKKDYSQIGNVFETKEEAEKAVEKLKAWKRLKDKGLVIKHHEESTLCGQITELWVRATFGIKQVFLNDTIKDDLDLLFGGKK